MGHLLAVDSLLDSGAIGMFIDVEYVRTQKLHVKCWNSNLMWTRGNVKEGLELTLMSSFDVEQGGVNSGPDSHGVLEWVWTDGPGFSLCAAPLESSGPD